MSSSRRGDGCSSRSASVYAAAAPLRIASTVALSRILKDHPHMAESRVESYRMWGEHVWSIMDCRDRRAARGIARSGGLIRSRGVGSGTRDIAVAGGVDQLESGGFCEVARHRRGAEG